MTGKEESFIARNGAFTLRMIWTMGSATLTLLNFAWILTGEISVLMGMALLAVVPISGTVVMSLEYGLERYTTTQEGLEQ